MTAPTTPPKFRRAATPPLAKTATPRPPIPAGQVNTAAHGANGTVRLNKRMAELGLASRREADDWIAKGWVKVNNFRTSHNKLAYAYVLTSKGLRAKVDATAAFLQRKRSEYARLEQEIAELRAEVMRNGGDPGHDAPAASEPLR